MKRLKLSLLVLLVLLKVNVFGARYIVYYSNGTGYYVNCIVGDTIRFTNQTGNNIVGVAIDFVGQPSSGIPALGGYYDYEVPALTPGEHLYTMIIHQNATSTGTLNVGIVTGINEQENATGNIKLFPNPATDVISIEMTTIGDIAIYSVTGELISTEKLHTGTNEISVAELPTGIYFIAIGNRRIRFVKT